MSAEGPKLWLSWSPLRECPSIRWIVIIIIFINHCHSTSTSMCFFHEKWCFCFPTTSLIRPQYHMFTSTHLISSPPFHHFQHRFYNVFHLGFSFCKVRVALGVLVLRGLVTTSSSARRPHVVDYTIQVCSKKCWDY